MVGLLAGHPDALLEHGKQAALAAVLPCDVAYRASQGPERPLGSSPCGRVPGSQLAGFWCP